MSGNLAEALREHFHERRSTLDETGFTLTTFDDLQNRSSFGVYAELNEKGFYLTAWTSGEVQTSMINYNTDPAPSEKYVHDLTEEQLRSLFDDLAAWLSGDGTPPQTARHTK